MVSSRTAVCAAVAAVAVVVIAPVSGRAQGSTYRLDIPAQDLGAALRAFGRSTRLQLIFDEAAVRGKRVGELSGSFSAAEALRRLLSGTGLEQRVLGGVSVIRQAPPSPQAFAAPAPARRATAATIRTEPPDAGPTDTILGEIVVTATLQAQRLDRVPLSVTAMTQESRDQKGISSIYDLARAVPALSSRIFQSAPAGSIQGNVIAIRGIVSSAGAATTALYLDDVPLHRRSVGNSGSGTPVPRLFDLERIEVLRGPQGTLFGGSSEGGAIRFITPTPSVTQRSRAARVQFSTTQGGDPSVELGLASGGPLIEGRLGFRASMIASRSGGYIDHIAPSTGRAVLEDSNWERSYAVRGALVWRAGERLTIEPSVYIGGTHKHDVDSYWLNVPAYILPVAAFGADGRPASEANPVRFIRPALNYPALESYGVGKSGELGNSPRTERLAVYALNLEYDFGAFTARAITGLSLDTTSAYAHITPNLQNLHLPLWGGYSQLTPEYQGTSHVRMHRQGLSQELRLTSRQDRRLNWVAGLFYSHSIINSRLLAPEPSLDVAAQRLRGVSATAFYGVDFEQTGFITSAAFQDWNDITLAGFADGALALSQRLTVTTGVRVSRERFRFNSCTWGIARGVSDCTIDNANLASAATSETPVSPKVGLTYQIDDRKMVYLTAARGFRTGGVNIPVPNSPTCNTAAALIGRTPTTFAPDYVTSYEAGAKLRLFDGRLQVNSSAFLIDWTDIQLQVALPGCSFSYTANAGRAQSRGFDATAQAKLGRGLTLDVSLAYTDARYTRTTINRDSAGMAISAVAFKGDQLPIAPLTVDLALNYSFPVVGRRRGYARIDYNYSSPYHRTVGPGAISFAPDVYRAGKTEVVNARLGLILGQTEVSMFARNLFDSRDVVDQNGGRVCGRLTDPGCAAPTQVNVLHRATTFRPRELGLTASYRY